MENFNAMNTENLFNSLVSILVPKDYLKDFEIVSVEEKPSEWVITLHEKTERIPPELNGKQ
jgi:ribosomal protein S8